MPLNLEILKKLNEKTKNNESLKKFLTDVFCFENNEASGWYGSKYQEFLKKHCKVEKNDEI